MTLPIEEVARLSAELGLVAVYLHGSCASGSDRPDSDLDLAVLAPAVWAEDEFGRAAERLAAAIAPLMGRPVDVIDVQDLRAAPAGFRRRVITTGRLLFAGDTTALARFQAHSMSEAWDEAYFLKPIREAMRKRIEAGRFAT